MSWKPDHEVPFFRVTQYILLVMLNAVKHLNTSTKCLQIPHCVRNDIEIIRKGRITTDYSTTISSTKCTPPYFSSGKLW